MPTETSSANTAVGKVSVLIFFSCILICCNLPPRIKVPVVAIFTKFDGLVTMAYNELRKKQSIKEAKNRKFEIAESILKANFIDPLKEMTRGPKDWVRMDGKPTRMKRKIITYLGLNGKICDPTQAIASSWSRWRLTHSTTTRWSSCLCLSSRILLISAYIMP